MPAVDELPPVRIQVTPEGVAEDWLLRALGLTSAQVLPLHGEIIGAPRHYRYRHGRYLYTADGVRALAAHFGLPVELQSGAAAPATRAPEPPPQPMWWQKDNA